MNILLTCVGRRHYLVDYFRSAISRKGRVIGTDMDLSAPALQICDVRYQVPGVFEENYLDCLKKIIVEEKVDMVFSLNDLEIGLLAKNRGDIEKETGATLYTPDLNVYSICADKWKTYQFAEENGIKAPKTFLYIDDAMCAIEENIIKFPLIIKPRWGSGSIGIFIAKNTEELRGCFVDCLKSVSKSGLSHLGSENSVIIQEFIDGNEYGLDLLYNKKEKLIGFAAKRKLAMRAGETDKAISVDPSPFADLIKKISNSLPHRGNLDCDFLEKDGEYYLLELNPRFGGGYPFTHLSGANHVQMLIDDYQNKKLDMYSYTVGKGFSKYDNLVEFPANN